MRVLISVRSGAIDDENVAFLNKHLLIPHHVSGGTAQNNDKLGKVHMNMHPRVFLVPAILNKEGECLVMGKPIQINFVHRPGTSCSPNFFAGNVRIVLVDG
ncbi:hypothetical protein D3C73_1381980 [compost metagenome]